MKSKEIKQKEAIQRNLKSMSNAWQNLLADENLAKQEMTPKGYSKSLEDFKAKLVIRRRDLTDKDLVCMKLGVPKKDWKSFQKSSDFGQIYC